jgi:hypothetical protein
MTYLKENSRLVTICLLILVLLSFVYSFVTGEDSLGKAEHDYIRNNFFLYSFSENFNLAIQKYGTYGEVRNLPTFNIIFAQFIKLGIEISNLKYLNLPILILLIFYFLKSLKIKYKNLSLNSKILFSCIILLSPTIRSLVNFTYPFLWALCFFVISIFFYLNFKNYETNKLKNALYCILHLVIASYITPNFSVFIIIFLFQFFKEFQLSKSFFQICFFSFILSLPALSFLIYKDFYIFKNEVFSITYSEKFNVSNKIIIITSILSLFFIPYLVKWNIKKDLTSIKLKSLFYISCFFLLCIFFFDFEPGAGGGIFYQFSKLFFKNNFFLFFIFFASLLLFNFFGLYNIENFIIFISLILYNLQYTIYYKYYDPLLLFIFLFLAKIKKNDTLDINNLGKRYFIFYVFFLLLNIFKDNLRLLLI